jgi:hypothetical protein
MKLKDALAASAAAVTAAAPNLVFAASATLTGSVDPTTGLNTIGSWFLGLAGVAIPIICAFKGTHAVAQGQHLMPYIGGAVGGSVLCFGGSYILANY